MNRFLLFTLVAACSTSSIAQTSTYATDSALAQIPRSHWALGAGISFTDSPYAGEGTRITPFPLIIYEGDRFFFHGTTAGWRLTQGRNFELSAITSLRLDGINIDDLGRRELAENGLDYRLLEDRDHGLDAGLAARWKGHIGELELKLLADISGTSDGHAVSTTYGYPMQWGKTNITPNIGVSWLSSDMANYYYGTLNEEVRRGVTHYRPGAVTIPHFGVTAVRPLGEKWALIGSIEYRSLPDEIRDSPLMDADKSSSSTFRFGISRSF